MKDREIKEKGCRVLREDCHLPAKLQVFHLMGFLTLTAVLAFPAHQGGLTTAFAEEHPYTAEQGPVGSQGGAEDGAGPGNAEEMALTQEQTDGNGNYTAVDGNQIPEENLLDNVVEYGELGSLIHRNNADVQIQSGSSERMRQEYSEIRTGLWVERKDAESKKNAAEREENAEDYSTYASYEEVYRSALGSYNKMIKKLDRSSTNQGRLTLEKQLTNAAQSLMISYESTKLQMESLEQSEALYRQIYEEVQAGRRAGLNTETEERNAYKNWNHASILLTSLESSEDSIYRNLCQILGVEAGGNTGVSEIPAFDVQLLAHMELERDTQNALWSNTAVKSTRQSASDGSSSGINAKQRTLAGQEEELKTAMANLYGEVHQARLSLDAASAGYSSAQIIWESAEKSNALGLLSRSGYIQANLNYLQKKNEFMAEELNLRQAYETYQWAVKGILNIE